MSELPGRTEVLVVGAGPVGLAVAASLAGHGHDVTVVDRQATGANTSRAAVVHARTLEMLERIGVSKRLAGLGIHASQFSIRDGDRELVPVRFDSLPTEYPYTLMVPQNITERVLLDRLEELGGRVHRPYVATGVSQTADGAEVTLESGHVIKAQYVVAADGMNSTIRDLAGLGDDGNDALSLSFTLADVRVEGGLPAGPGSAVLLHTRHVGRGPAPGRVVPARGRSRRCAGAAGRRLCAATARCPRSASYDGEGD